MPFTLPLDEMTQEEKLAAMEALWRDLSSRPDELESPAWHGEVLRERLRQVEAGEMHFLPWEDAQKRIDALVAQRRAAKDAKGEK